MRLIKQLAKWSIKVEAVFIVFLFGMTLFLACGQIVLRSLFNTTFSWTDPLIRHSVLWLGFLGALWSTRNGSHLKIEIAKFLLSPLHRIAAQLAANAFSFAICAILAWQSIRFVLDEISYGNKEIAGIGIWIFQCIFPVVFSLMALRFLLIFSHYIHTSLRLKRKR